MAYVSSRSALVLALTIVLMIIVAAPALAVEKAPFDTPPPPQAEYGQHHAWHAPFSGDMNPGVHQGIYDWPHNHEH